MNKKVSWLEENCNTLDGYFGLSPGDDYRGDRNLALRELSKAIVFITQDEAATDNQAIGYTGFDSLEEAFEALIRDMVGNAYSVPGLEDRFYLLEKDCIIKGTLFQGRVVRFHPVTSHVAVLVQDPIGDSADRSEPFDTMAGMVPYINLEVIENERQEGESIEETSDRGDDGERSDEDQPVTPECNTDSEGTST